MYNTSAAFSLQWANNRQSFYTPGDIVVVPLLITTDNLLEHLPGPGKGPATEFTFQILSGSPSWLRVEQPQVCTTDECKSGVHWEERQTYWVELVGTPPAVSARQNLNGRVQVCHTPTGVCKQVPFSFNLVPTTGDYGLRFRDPAANYGAQLEMRTALFAPDGVTKKIQSPYFDYYLKPSSLCFGCTTYRVPTVEFWYSPYPSTCFRVSKCDDNLMRIRTMINQDVTVSSATHHEIQLGYWESWTSTLDEKTSTQSLSQLDPSYLYPTAKGPVFAQRANARWPHYNAMMPLYDGNGVLLSGYEHEDAGTCEPAVLGVDFYSSTPAAICVSNSLPVFQHEQDQIDTIYQGEDYLFIPKISDPDGQPVQMILQNSPDWLEIGSPNDFLSSYLWPHHTDSRLMVRSKYSEVRQKIAPAPGIYGYQLVASDGAGGSVTLRRKIRIRPAAAHASAAGHRVGALIGDETWFIRGQLDIAAGIQNLTDQHLSLSRPWMDYYLEWHENFTVNPKVWYLNPGVSISYVSCGDKRNRLRIHSSESVPIYANGSTWDNKIGFVFSTSAPFDKTDDPSYGSGDFIDPLSAQWVDARRKLNSKVALFSGEGNWEWGETPIWAKDCPDPAIGREVAPRPGWYTQFFDVDSSAETVEPRLRLDNVDLASQDVGGTMVRTYFKVMGPHTRPYLITAQDMGNYTVSLNVCGVYNDEYALLFRLKEGVKFDDYGRLREDLQARARITLKRRDKNGQIQIANLFEDLEYANTHRFVESGSITVYDSDTNLVHGTEIYTDCRSLVSSSDTSENVGQWSGLEVMFKDGVPPDYLKQTNIHLGIRNSTNERFIMAPEDYIRYYFIYNEEDVLDGPQYYDTMKTEIYWGGPIVQIESCKGNLKSVKYTSGTTRTINALSSFAGGGLFSNLDLRVSHNSWPRYNKENDYSYLATNTMTPNHRIVIFRGNGEPISGILPEDEDGPVLCPGDKLESGVGYLPCKLYWDPVQSGGLINVSDTAGIGWSGTLNIQAFPEVGYRFVKWQTQSGSAVLGRSTDLETNLTQACGANLSAVFEKVSDIQTGISAWDTAWQCVDNSSKRSGLQFVSLWSDGDSVDVILASRELGLSEYSLYLDGGNNGDSLYGYERRLRIRPGLSVSQDSFVAGHWVNMKNAYLSQTFNVYNESVPGYGVFEPGYLTEIRVKKSWKNTLRWWVDGFDHDIGSPASPMVLTENENVVKWMNQIDGRVCDWTWTCVSSSSSSSSSAAGSSSSSAPGGSSSSRAASLASNTLVSYNTPFARFVAEPLESWMVGRSIWMQIESSGLLGDFDLRVNGNAVTIPSGCGSSAHCQVPLFTVPSDAFLADVEIEFPSARAFSVKWWST